jgi:hypothetical protein
MDTMRHVRSWWVLAVALGLWAGCSGKRLNTVGETAGEGGNGGELPPSCGNGVRSGSETDIDCGGDACAPCAAGKACLVGSDCEQSVCGDGSCRAATCSDGVRNDMETDIDCGGGCAPCSDGKICRVAADCSSGRCDALSCASCNDGLKNGDESGTDCGGSCQGCAVGEPCNTASDCESKACGSKDFVGMICYPGHCKNDMHDGDETDFDCGGSCPTCNTGDYCTRREDCSYGPCSLGVCIVECTDAASCGDHGSCTDGRCTYCENADDCKPDVCVGLTCDCKNGVFVCK